MTKVLITGADGFIGYHLCKYLLENTDWNIVAQVRSWRGRRIPYQWNQNPRFAILQTDLTKPVTFDNIQPCKDVDYVFNLASRSHIEESIQFPGNFIRENVDVQTRILDFVRQLPNVSKFIQLSSDEVYGPQLIGENDIHSPFRPTNPYGASKAAQEVISNAYYKTYGVPVIIVNTMSVFGPKQNKEKLVPRIIEACLNQEPFYVHQGAAPRTYMYVETLCYYLKGIAELGVVAENDPYANAPKIHIVDNNAYMHVEGMLDYIQSYMGVSLERRYVDIDKVRPNHPRRFAMKSSYLTQFVLQPFAPFTFEEGLEKTIDETVKDKDFR